MPTPLWKGPVEDGITFSLLSKFLFCRHRFYLLVVKGLDEDEGFNHNLEFGSIWHAAEEAHAKGQDPDKAVYAYSRELRSKYPGSEQEIRKWTSVCLAEHSVYIDYWAKHPETRQRKYYLSERGFRVPYSLPSGRHVNLRGKIDQAFTETARSVVRSHPSAAGIGLTSPNSSHKVLTNASHYVQENKTKGKIDEEGLTKTVSQNLQSMLYVIAHNLMPKMPTATGVLYNVVRRPLSDQYAIRQKKMETEKQFYSRLQDGIKKEPEKYFLRWKVRLDKTDIPSFQRRIFNPLLEQLLDWWNFMQAINFEDPFTLSAADLYGHSILQSGYTFHYQFPWGVYNSIASGFRGDYFDLLTSGRQANLKKIDTLFPELSKHKPTAGRAHVKA